ncbi:fungal hydrophobin-domain-containing protein [Boletus coccyginus]|nr:fungal hydrophobin-domain-containing protein [Boletus coccyginus]
MFSRLATLIPIVALVAVATADSVSQCNTEDQYCCNTAITQTTQSLGLIDVLGGLDLGAGITCTPISIIGIPGNSCTQQPVCCTDNNFNGAVNLACTPINVNA